MNLPPRKPLVAPALDLLADPRQVATVVAADDVDRDAVAVPAPEPPERLPERLADGVPDREIDARERDQADAAVAQLVEGDGIAELPAALVGERVLADEPRRDLVADHADDVGQRLVLIGGVGLADDSLLGDTRVMTLARFSIR